MPTGTGVRYLHAGAGTGQGRRCGGQPPAPPAEEGGRGAL